MTAVELIVRTSAETGAIEVVTKKVRELSNEAGRTTAAGQQLASSFQGVLAGALPLTLSIAGVTSALLAGLTAGVAYNASIEQQSVAFRTLLGSADAAATRMRELADFAATTPFELPELVNASRILQSLAGNELAAGDGLRLIGDAAAATGRSFDEMAMWAGRLYAGLKSGTPVGEATMRLIEMGAISGDTARQLNALAESGAAVDRPFKLLRETFGRFDGAMALQGETFKGLVSTLKDTVMGDLAKATESLTSQMKGLIRAWLEAKGIVDSREQVARTAAQGQLNAYGGRLGNATSAADITKLRGDLLAERVRVENANRAETDLLNRARPLLQQGIQRTGPPEGDMTTAQFNDRARMLGDQVRYVAEIARLEAAAANDGQRLLAEARGRQAQRVTPSKAEAESLTKAREQTAQLEHQSDVLEFRALPLEQQRAQLIERQQRLAESAQEINRLALINERPRQELDLRRATLRRDELTTAEELRGVEHGLANERREAANAAAKASADATKAAADTIAQLEREGRELDTLNRKRLEQDLAAIHADWRSTPGEQRDAQLGRSRQAVTDGTMSGDQQGLEESQLGPDPRSWADSWTAMLTELRGANEAFAQHFIQSVGQAFQQSMSLAADGLTAAIFQTKGWQDQLARIPLMIGMQIVSAIIRMGIQWVATQVMMALFGKALMAAAVAATVPLAAASAVIWAVPATLATIASYGGAAVAAPAFIATANAATLAESLAGFAVGGETPGQPTLAWVGEQGPELVIPAAVNARLSRAQKSALVAGDFDDFAQRKSSGAGSNGSLPAAPARQNHYHYWDRAAFLADSRDDLEAVVHDVIRRTA